MISRTHAQCDHMQTALSSFTGACLLACGCLDPVISGRALGAVDMAVDDEDGGKGLSVSEVCPIILPSSITADISVD